jgi:predicted Na+-dependent transporter
VNVVAGWLERWLLPLVLALAALGLLWPGPARQVADDHGITVALVVLVGAVGLGLPASAIGHARLYLGRIAVTVAASTVVLPAIAFVASRTVPEGPLRWGVLAAGVAPSEVAAVALTTLAGGSAAICAAVLVGSTVASVLLAGPILHVLAGSGSMISSGSLLLSLFLIVAVPLTVTAVVRARLPRESWDRADQVSSIVASGAVLVLIWLVAGQADLGPAFLRAGLALALYLAGATALAVLLTVGLPRSTRLSLLLPVAMRDFAIAAGIASQAFGPSASAALGLYGVLVLLFGAVTARFTGSYGTPGGSHSGNPWEFSHRDT